MHRRRFLLAATVCALLPMRAALADYVDDVVTLLESQGFTNIEVTRTLLGRTRILARNATGTRELVLNARTGEVLRDVWMNASGQQLPGLANVAGSDDEDDDHGGRDDDDDDDHSGPGGGDDDEDDDDSGQGRGRGRGRGGDDD